MERKHEWMDRVPKGLHENLRFRRRLLEEIETFEDPHELCRSLWTACSEDVLFYVNVFAWTYDPRRKVCDLPFVTYDFQDDLIARTMDAVEAQHDLVVVKSRDMGASWCVLAVVDWLCRFRAGKSVLLGSRKEEFVDKSGDPKTLFWKLDYLHSHLPAFLQGARERRNLHITYGRTGSVVDGESTNENFARGDRRTLIVPDEFAAVPDSWRIMQACRDAANCRIFISTPQGSSNAFAAIAQNPDYEVVNLAWETHPLKRRGLYRVEGPGEIVRLDRDYVFPEDYRFDWPFPGKATIRSPWFDAQCKRAGSWQEIASELQRDFIGSDSQYYDDATLKRIERESVRAPLHVGEVRFDRQTGEFLGWEEREDGRWRFWVPMTEKGFVDQQFQAVAGVDVASGSASGSMLEQSSKSTIFVLNKTTAQQIGQFSAYRLMPHEFAIASFGAFSMLAGLDGDYGPQAIWESNGPGATYGRVLMGLGFRHVWWRRNEQEIAAKRTAVPGFWSSTTNNNALLEEFGAAMTQGLLTIHGPDVTREARTYILTNERNIEHSWALNAQNPADRRQNHADMFRAAALAWWAVRESVRASTLREREKRLERAADANEARHAPYLSFAWRAQQYDLKKRKVYY